MSGYKTDYFLISDLRIKSYRHASGLAQRIAIFEGTELELTFEESPKSVMATVNSFCENRTFLQKKKNVKEDECTTQQLP